MECEEEGYPARTRRNVADSTGTLLVGDHRSGGSRLTYQTAKELKKEIFLLPFPGGGLSSRDQFVDWLKRHEIEVLNVAGNRESQSPGISEFTRAFLVSALGD
jgi:hypothetical protein